MHSWLFFAVNILFLGYIIRLFYQKSRQLPLRSYFFPALLGKLFAGIVLGVLYLWYFKGGDTLNYFHDAQILGALASENLPQYLKALFAYSSPEALPKGLIFAHQPRALLFSKILSFFSFITNHNYWLISLYLSLLSFLGFWYLANKLTALFPETHFAAAFAFLFFPSVVFWSSGVMKESIAMPALCILVAFSLNFLNKPPASLKQILLKITIALLLLWLLWQLKYYYFGILVPILATTLLVILIERKMKIASISTKILIWIGLFVSLSGLASLVHPNLQLENFLTALVRNHDLIYQASSPENLIHYDDLLPTWMSLLENLPIALLSGLYRPMIWEMHTPFHILLTLENCFLVLLTILSILHLRKTSWSKVYSVFLFPTIVYIILMATLMALASPNFGSLARYRVGFLPFFVYMLFCGSNLNKLIHRFVKG